MSATDAERATYIERRYLILPHLRSISTGAPGAPTNYRKPSNPTGATNRHAQVIAEYSRLRCNTALWLFTSGRHDHGRELAPPRSVDRE